MSHGRHARSHASALLLALLGSGCVSNSGYGGGLAPSWWITRHEVRGVVESGQPLAGPDAPMVITASRYAGPEGAPDTSTTLRCTEDGMSTQFLVVPLEQRVHFRNDSGIYHQFFSTSEGNTFELGALAPEATETVRFHRPGLVHVYCELHSGKQTTLFVTPSPYFAVVGPGGEFTLAGLPRGSYRVEAWREGRTVQRTHLEVPGADERMLRIAADEPHLRGAR